MPSIVWRTAARLLLQKKAIAADNAAAKQPSSEDVGITWMKIAFIIARKEIM